MPDPFDLDAAFDDDYLHFHAAYLTDERAAADTALIAELLELAPDARVLDLACGQGRIAVRLAEVGCRVTGLDRSAPFLARARALAAAHGVDVLWLEADSRHLAMVEEFDAVVHWFTSFGYFDDATNRDLLRRMRRALVPGGRLLLETVNLFHAAFDADAWNVTRVGPDVMIDLKQYHSTTGRWHVERTLIRAGRPVREFEFSVRLFSPVELIDWLETAGFVDVVAYGADGGPYEIDSERLILTAATPR